MDVGLPTDIDVGNIIHLTMTRGKVVDLFCGAGGASLGFVQAGYEVVGAVDADQHAIDTYKKNLCERSLDEYQGSVTFDKPLRADLSRGYEDGDLEDQLPSITFQDIREYFDLDKGDIDVVCGCPPCQNFSSLRDTDPWPKGKPKDTLLRSYVGFIEEEIPDVVFFENVSNIMNVGEEMPTDYVNWLIRKMRSVLRQGDSKNEGGYGHDLQVVNAADYGVPQKRKRTIGLFVYGVKDADISLPEPTHTKNPTPDDERESWITVNDRLNRDTLLEELELGQKQVGVDGYPDDPAHRARNHHESTVELIEAIRRHGGSWRDLRGTEDEDLIKECHQDLDSGATSAYGIMNGNEPAPTLTTRCTNVSSGRFTHPSQNRAITFREAALLMDFPEWYELPSINKAAERVIGNAVPPKLVKSVVKDAARYISTPEGDRTYTSAVKSD